MENIEKPDLFMNRAHSKINREPGGNWFKQVMHAIGEHQMFLHFYAFNSVIVLRWDFAANRIQPNGGADRSYNVWMISLVFSYSSFRYERVFFSNKRPFTQSKILMEKFIIVTICNESVPLEWARMPWTTSHIYTCSPCTHSIACSKNTQQATNSA